jgi:hypothetical protein
MPPDWTVGVRARPRETIGLGGIISQDTASRRYVMLRSRWLPALAAAIGMLSLAAPAGAGMLPINVSVLPEAGAYRWTYSVVVPTNQYVTSGDYFTIYDFEGLTSASSITAPAGWTATVSKIGKTPGLTTPIDDPNKDNLSFTYTGDPVYGGVGLGNFSAASTLNQIAEGFFTSRVHRSSDNKTEDSITFSDVPRPSTNGGGPPSESPEPATLVIMGMGLPVLGLARVIRRKR